MERSRFKAAYFPDCRDGNQISTSGVRYLSASARRDGQRCRFPSSAAEAKEFLGIDDCTSPHDQGSSHGGSRMIRQNSQESPGLRPGILGAWPDCGENSNGTRSTQLLHITGGINIGSRDGDLVTRSIAAAEKHSIPFDVLERLEISRRFPVFVPQPNDVAVHEPHAGYLLPEDCVRAHLKLASSCWSQWLLAFRRESSLLVRKRRSS